MSGQIRSVRTLGLVASSALLVLAVAGSVAARTWHVPSECLTIHAGLDSASYGDTVLVAPGIYLKTDDPEALIQPGPGVFLLSEGGPEETIIEICNSSGGISLWECEGARVSGFTIRFGSGPGCELPPALTEGIICFRCTDVIIENCIIENVCYGIQVYGTSSEWWKPVIRNNVIFDAGIGIACYDVVNPGRPFIQGNTIANCRYGVDCRDSAPIIDGNRITDCSQWGLHYWGHCGGNCTRNTIAYNTAGVYAYADPPLATPDFNGTWLPEEANDFYSNGSCDIRYEHADGQGFLMAIYNYWGSRCPDFPNRLQGEIIHSPWMDSTHTAVLDQEDCPDATVPTTWGSIKAMFR